MKRTAHLAFAAFILAGCTGALQSGEMQRDEIVISVREPRRPDLYASSFEARCGRSLFSLKGISGGGRRFGGPIAELNGRRQDLPPEIESYLLDHQAVYRISARCPPTTPEFGLVIHRAEPTSDGSVSYSNWGLDIEASGHIRDRGRQPGTAESFWFR